VTVVDTSVVTHGAIADADRAFAWGDGATLVGAGTTASHTYSTDGTFTLSLTVTARSSTGAAPVTTTVSRGVTVAAPVAGTITFNVSLGRERAARDADGHSTTSGRHDHEQVDRLGRHGHVVGHGRRRSATTTWSTASTTSSRRSRRRRALVQSTTRTVTVTQPSVPSGGNRYADLPTKYDPQWSRCCRSSRGRWSSSPTSRR
jgi:hypothetical protein